MSASDPKADIRVTSALALSEGGTQGVNREVRYESELRLDGGPMIYQPLECRADVI
jgi:hypothetical protein